jgi:hypothetical protein
MEIVVPQEQVTSITAYSGLFSSIRTFGADVAATVCLGKPKPTCVISRWNWPSSLQSPLFKTRPAVLTI